MSDSIIKILYMVSCIFFIRGIKLLGKTDTARKGNLYSSIGMLIACVTVLCEKQVIGSWSSNPLENGYVYIAAAIVLGSVIGIIWSKKVEMTGMPQLVALFNGFGGLSSLLVAIAQYVCQPKGDYFTELLSMFASLRATTLLLFLLVLQLPLVLLHSLVLLLPGVSSAERLSKRTLQFLVRTQSTQSSVLLVL